MMKSLCTKCAGEYLPTIEVEKIFEKLLPGEYWSGEICDECGLMMIHRTIEGEIKVIRNAEIDTLSALEDY